MSLVETATLFCYASDCCRNQRINAATAQDVVKLLLIARLLACLPAGLLARVLAMLVVHLPFSAGARRVDNTRSEMRGLARAARIKQVRTKVPCRTSSSSMTGHQLAHLRESPPVCLFEG